jgi:hypothetical protein
LKASERRGGRFCQELALIIRNYRTQPLHIDFVKRRPTPDTFLDRGAWQVEKAFAHSHQGKRCHKTLCKNPVFKAKDFHSKENPDLTDLVR